MSNDPKLLKLFAAESAINIHRQVMREFIVQGMNLEDTLNQPKMKEIVEILKPGFDDQAIEILVNKKHLSIYYILDGSAYTKHYGSTPKERLLNCLKTLRQEWINKKEVTEPWNESEHKRWGMC